jgi:6-phosphogluconate dehydrogenase
MTNQQPQKQYELGIVDFGVVGRNLLLNMVAHAFAVAGYDKDAAKVEALAFGKTPHAPREETVLMQRDQFAEHFRRQALG